MKLGLKLKKLELTMDNVQSYVELQHAFMPITVRVVSDEEYAEWLSDAKVNLLKNRLLENENIKNSE